LDGGPILRGAITDIHKESEHHGTVTLQVLEKLRDSNVADKLEVPFDSNGEKTGAFFHRPPVWYGVVPKPGKQILLLLKKGTKDFRPTCVVDADQGGAEAVDVVKRLARLESAPEQERTALLEGAFFNDPSQTVRSYALRQLTGSSGKPEARKRIFEVEVPHAMNPSDPRREEALDALEWAYNGFEADNTLNYRILSVFAELTADKNSSTKGHAMGFLHSVFLGAGKRKPDITKVNIPQKAKLALQMEAQSPSTHSEQARDLLNVIGRKQYEAP